MLQSIYSKGLSIDDIGNYYWILNTSLTMSAVFNIEWALVTYSHLSGGRVTKMTQGPSNV